MDTLVNEIQTRALIGDTFEAGEGTPEPIVNPRTGKVILEVAEASDAQVDRAVSAARAAFSGWSVTTPAERSAVLLRIAERIETTADNFAALEALNCGKPIHAARNDEIPAIVDCFRFFAGAVRCQHGALAGEYLAGHTSMIRRDAVGVVASIAPWNYPLMMMAWKLAPAIGGGNTVVFKPSEQTPLTALLLARILAEELPKGVVNVIPGRGQTVGSRLVNHPDIDMISLTGDVGTGRKMLEAAVQIREADTSRAWRKGAGDRVRRCRSRRGGRRLRAFGYYNAGQDCTAACRIYAGGRIYDRLVADLSAAVGEISLAREDDTPTRSAR
jgi:aminobutyraldehyde dehydrogenase